MRPVARFICDEIFTGDDGHIYALDAHEYCGDTTPNSPLTASHRMSSCYARAPACSSVIALDQVRCAQVVPGAEHSLRHPDSHIANSDEGDARHFNVSVIRLSAKLAVL